MTRDEIHETLVEILAESFELEPEEIKRESKLYEELGLDSIDAVDIFVQLREITGRRPDPAEARKVRTVDDLILFVERELEAAEKGLPEPEVQRPTDPRALAQGDGGENGPDDAPRAEKKAAVGGE
jgi:acyl carrier protein